jgi:hypothetical protein
VITDARQRIHPYVHTAPRAETFTADLRIGVGPAIIQPATDPACRGFATFVVSATSSAGGIELHLGLLTSLAAGATRGQRRSRRVRSTALLFTGARTYILAG